MGFCDVGGDNNYVTTDDESVGQGRSNKLRRPRAKLVVQTTGAATAADAVGSHVSSTAASNGTDAAALLDDKAQQQAGGSGAVLEAQAGAAAETEAATAIAKAKRRGRSVVGKSQSNKEKEREKEKDGFTGAGNNAPGAPSSSGYVPGTSPWDTQLDQW
jgi:type IV secretory pathway TrbL component